MDEYIKLVHGRTRTGIDVCSTGIEGLDKVLGGGVPCGSTILVEGPPGAGKTSLAARFLYEAAVKNKEKGAYVSFVENKESFYTFMKKLGLDFEELENKGLFTFIEAIPIHNEEALRLILERLIMEVLEKQIRRIVIDSITVLIHAFGAEKAREILTTLILRELKKLGVTTLLIAEKPRSYTEAEISIEEYIADTVIELNYRIEYGKMVRYMRILKARGTSIPLSELTFTLTKGQVIGVFTPIIPHEIPAVDSETRYITGVPIIDKVLGEIPRGSQTLIVTEPGLDALVAMMFGLLPLIARYDGPSIIMSFTRSPDEVKRLISNLSLKLNIKSDDVLSKIEVISINPTTLSLQELASFTARIELNTTPKFIGIHGLNVLLELYPSVNVYLATHLNNVLLRRKLGITSFYTYTANLARSDIPGIDIYDIVVYVEKIEEEGEEYYKITMFRHPTTHRFKTIKVRPHEILLP